MQRDDTQMAQKKIKPRRHGGHGEGTEGTKDFFLRVLCV